MEICFWFFFSTSSILSYFALLLWLSGIWILSFPLIKVSEVFFLLFLQVIRCSSGDSPDTLAPCSDIPERLGLSFLRSISFGGFVILSEKLADEIDLDLFIIFTVSYVSVVWVDLDLSNEIDLSNDQFLSDLLLMDLSFYLLDTCGLSISLNVSILFVAIGWVVDSFTTVGFVLVSLIPYLIIFM